MNRQIKFRAWDKKKMEIRWVLALRWWEREFSVVELADVIFAEIQGSRNGAELDKDEVILMQYTGFKDKNEKEIYEGDVLRWDKRYEGEVYWTKDGWAVKNFWQSSQDEPGRAFSENAEFEVIGNIYENPELLK